MQQLLTEGLILSIMATLGGIIVAYWCRNALVLAFPAQAPGIIVNLPGQIDWRVLLASAGVCVLATMVFALAPALQVSKVNLADAINSGASGVVGARGRSRLRSAFVLIQMSLSFVLIVGAGLLMLSLRQIQRAPAGFSTEDVLLSGVDLLSAGYKPDRAMAFQDQLLERVRPLPGVESATFARVIPFGLRDFSSAPIAVEGYQLGPDDVERPTTIRSDRITSRSWELRCSAAASSRATTTPGGHWSQSWMRRWRHDIGQESIWWAGVSSSKING